MVQLVDLKSAKDPACDPDKVLENAKGHFESVLVLGYSKGSEVIEAYASLNLTAAQIFFLMEQFKHKLLNGDYYDED